MRKLMDAMNLLENDLTDQDKKMLDFSTQLKTPRDLTDRESQLFDDFVFHEFPNLSTSQLIKVEKYITIVADLSKLFIAEYFSDLGDQTYVNKEYLKELIEEACGFLNITTEGQSILRRV